MALTKKELNHLFDEQCRYNSELRAKLAEAHRDYKATIDELTEDLGRAKNDVGNMSRKLQRAKQLASVMAEALKVATSSTLASGFTFEVRR